MFIELHILQNFAPSNLNRDDTGNPKDTEFGGVRRARVSSQAIKRSIRWHDSFKAATTVENGARTRWLARNLAKRLMKAGKPEEQANKAAANFASECLGDMDKKQPLRSNVLVYLDEDERQSMANAILENWDKVIAEDSTAVSKIVKEQLKNLGEFTSAPDVALFGRMLARKPTTLILNAACQVAHAISTHRVNMELDYFTAVDDLLTDEESGAGHVNVTAFNSACFYRYARIDWDLLVKNLNDDKELARKTVEGFLRAAALAIPSGKQNAFAAQNPPDFMFGVVRQDGQSWSLANAFEIPVKSGRDGGLMSASIEKLKAYWEKLNKVYGGDGITSATLSLDGEDNMDGWMGKMLGALE
jgi:CRISPR system Cascade subunit CasC